MQTQTKTIGKFAETHSFFLISIKKKKKGGKLDSVVYIMYFECIYTYMYNRNFCL